MIKFLNENPEIFKEFSEILALPISSVRKSSLGEFEDVAVFSVSINDTLYLSPKLLESIRLKFPVTIDGYVIELMEYYEGEYDDQRMWEAQLMFSIEKDSLNALDEPFSGNVEVLEFLN